MAGRVTTIRTPLFMPLGAPFKLFAVMTFLLTVILFAAGWLAGAVGMVLWVCLMVWSIRTRNRWVLDGSTLSCRGPVFTRNIALVDVRSINIDVQLAGWTEWWTVVDTGNSGIRVFVRTIDQPELRAHLAEFAPHVGFGRADRWEVRRVTAPVEDPRRALRVVRRALVGPIEVRVIPVSGGFCWTTRHENGRGPEERGPVHPALADAMTDALAQIDRLEGERAGD